MRAVQALLGAFALLALAMSGTSMAQPAQATRAEAVFAGGCFWCVEKDFEHLDGVIEAYAGYAGGTRERPTYENHEGHLEAVRVVYDPGRISYQALLNHFWRHIDPLDAGGQFCDRGPSYRSAVFATAAQRAAAEASRAETQRILGRDLATPILAATQFWNAEEYHQDYYLKNPIPYRFYRLRCGRDARVAAVWRGH